MKAIVLHEYGGPEVLKYEDVADPVAKAGEVLVRVAATSVNPIDYKRRTGAMKEMFPVKFPGILGVDVAGAIEKVGPGVLGWKVGDQVIAFAHDTYAELCAVRVSRLVKVPAGADMVDLAALPLVVTTGYKVISEGTSIHSGQTVLVTGANGSVGRSAIFAAKGRGAKVIAGVRKKHFGAASELGVDATVAVDDDGAIAKLPPLDAVADCVGGNTAEVLIRKVKNGGVFASVLGAPAGAKDVPSVKVVVISATPDAAVLELMSQAVLKGKLSVPISRRVPLKDAAAAHSAIESGLGGKVLLLAHSNGR